MMIYRYFIAIRGKSVDRVMEPNSMLLELSLGFHRVYLPPKLHAKW